MAKPKPNDAEPVSLFPFLSILACLIGVLTFIIAGISIPQMDQSDEIEAAERNERYEPIVAQLETDRTELEMLRARHSSMQQMQDLRQQQTQAEQEAVRLQALIDNAEQIAALSERRNQANRQVQTLNQELEQLQAQIRTNQQTINERIADGRPAGTVVRPSGTGVNLRAIFIECNANNIIIHRPDAQNITVASGAIRGNEAYRNRCERVAGNEQLRLIFLVRPEGVGMYNAAARIARERQVRYGKIPVPGDGPIDVSDFDHE